MMGVRDQAITPWIPLDDDFIESCLVPPCPLGCLPRTLSIRIPHHLESVHCRRQRRRGEWWRFANSRLKLLGQRPRLCNRQYPVMDVWS